MIDVVLDASVVLKWFHREGEAHVEAARRLRARFDAGELRVMAPPLLWLELLSMAARRWDWSQDQLERLAATLGAIGFELVEPELSRVARWAAVGLTAYDAAYVAVSEQSGATLVTDDEQIVLMAPTVTTKLDSAPMPPRLDEPG
jgi:predicted nucleic acid-binding protein